jgi:hypothetical protein
MRIAVLDIETEFYTTRNLVAASRYFVTYKKLDLQERNSTSRFSEDAPQFLKGTSELPCCY